MIGIVDYGLGNITAFANLYKRLNMNSFFAKTPQELLKAEKIILPGVGAFDHAMDRLNDSGMREALDELVLEKKVPVLGICVGMQMMADSSDEGTGKGLGWISGMVRKFPKVYNNQDKELPLPHMGWNSLTINDDNLFQGLGQEKRFYFLHSYYFECNDIANSIATANYGFEFTCVAKRENIYGVQCHPEKSHHNGIALLKNFGEL